MLAHIVLFNFKPKVDSGQREQILALARNKLADIPGVHHLLVGQAVKTGSEHEHGLCMYFADEAALNAYREHPDHVHFRDEEFFPFLETVKGLDFAD